MIINKINLLHRNWINVLLYLIASIVLAACSTAGDVMPQGGPTMAQVYEDAMDKSNGSSLDLMRSAVSDPINTSVAYNGTTNLSPYTRTSENEINNLFPLSPNPQLVMYVYPHLAGTDEAPVPGYSTAFQLLEREHYAITGEN